MNFMNKIFLRIIEKILNKLVMAAYNSLIFLYFFLYKKKRALLDYEHMILVFGRNFFSS